MVLINGVKYACERCIRGHRVTTCTHTDQPLMMIKPKGRPSTQCDFCREQRRIRNSHVHCKCPRKINSKAPHDPDCPCHVDGRCICCQKKKRKGKDKDKDKEAEAEAALTPLAKASDSANGTPSSVPLSKPKIPVAKQNKPLAVSTTLFPKTWDQGTDLISPAMSELSNDMQNDILNSSQNNFNELSLSEAPSVSKTLDTSNVDNDEINRLLHSWDMSSPPMGNSESLASILSDTSLLNTTNKNNKNNNNSKRAAGPVPFQQVQMMQQFQQKQQQLHQQQQQLDDLQFLGQQQTSDSTISSRRGIGEITLPIDEYMKPLNKMNVHFNNFLNNLSDSQSDLTFTNGSNNIISNSNNIPTPHFATNSNNVSNLNSVNFLGNLDNNFANNNTGVSYNSYNVEDSQIPGLNASNNYNTAIDMSENNTSMTPGLLDFFESEDSVKINRNNVNTANTTVPSHQDNNYSKPAAIPDHEAESLFPFFSLIGPQSADDVAIGKTKAHPQQFMLNSQSKLKQNVTGSSVHSAHSFHSVKSNYSAQGHHPNQIHHHHNGSHNHIHQSHFQPYPSKSRRTGSFLSINSPASNRSSQSINSILSSPDSVAEAPRSFFGSADMANEYNGPQLTSAKTNTTLMDDIYQTKTYTDNQSVASSKQQNQQLYPQQQSQYQQSKQIQNNDPPSDSILSNILFSNGAISNDPALIDDFTGETLNNPVDENVGSIGTVPMTSSVYLSQRGQQTKNNDHYDEQLFQSLVNNNY